MKSRFSFWAYFLAFYTLLFTLLLAACFFSIVYYNNILPVYFYILITGGVIFVWIWLIFGELRNKVISVEIGYDSIIIKRYLGLGPPKTFYFDQIDGFKISVLSSRANLYEYLYIMTGDKKIAKLSAYYHRNYDELKQEIIADKFADLGFEDYSSVREMKEIFI